MLLKKEMTSLPSLDRHKEKLEEKEKTYRYLLTYVAEGFKDPSRNEVIDQIKDSLFTFNNIILREKNLVDASDIYSSTRRLESHRNLSFNLHLESFRKLFSEDNQTQIPELQYKISSNQAKELSEIFNYVWTLHANSIEYNNIESALLDKDLPDYLKSVIVAALVLGNINYFDPDAFHVLLNLLENEISLSLKSRTIAGIVLIALVHADRILLNISVRSRLLMTLTDPALNKIINATLLNLIRTYDTTRIDNKMRNEVIPELMKIRPEIIDRMKNLASDAEDFLSDENPQWEEMIENSAVGDKLKEINDMQMEGADVMVTAFSNLKSFPFFFDVSNWFMPFVPGNYLFDRIPLMDDEETMKGFNMVMCNSDLHSFLLSVDSMPEDKKVILFKNMESQMKEAQEALSNPIGESMESKINLEIRHYLQDLYRFFKFFRKKDDFEDPFSSPFVASQIAQLKDILGINVDTIRLIAEFYFKNKYYREAAGLFELLDSFDSDYSNWEKIGFCYDRMKDYSQALEWYRKAELVSPDKEWLVKKIAVALKNAGQPKEALLYYNKALKNDPDNYHLLMSAGQCYLDLNEIGDALQCFYHAQYLKPNNMGVLRALAWSELMASNYDKALNLYREIVSDAGAKASDFLNAAHCAMAVNDMKEAVKFYRKFIDLSPEKDIKTLVLALRDDALATKNLGIKTSDLRLIVDKIRYDLYSSNS